MELNELRDLLDEVYECFPPESFLKAKETGDMFHEQAVTVTTENMDAEGYILFIRDSIINESSRNCIKSIAKKRKLNIHLTIHNSEKYLVIYTPRDRESS